MPTPAGAAFKQAMLAWLTGLAGKHCISVQHILGQSQDLSTHQACFNLSGQWPGGIAGGYYNDGGGTGVSYASNATFIDYWNRGGLVLIDNGMPNPMGGGPFAAGTIDVGTILTPGSVANLNWVRIQTEIAVGLLQLQNAGVCPIYRPLHEANGNWNWYGTSGVTDDQYRRLWQDHYNFMVNRMGLTSLIWVYAKNASFEPAGANRFPGGLYCDITGVDGYTDSPSALAGDIAVLRNMGKPMCLAEFGAGSASLGNASFNMMDLITALKGPLNQCLWWTQWHDGNGGRLGWGFDKVSNLRAALTDPWVLNLGNLGRPVLIPIPASADGSLIYTPGDPPIITAAGESYTLLGTMQCGVGGVKDATSANVARMCYQGGYVYHQNQVGDVYRTLRSADPWQPSTWPLVVSRADLQTQLSQAQRTLTAVRLGLLGLTS